MDFRGIVDSFNNFFVNIGKNLADSIISREDSGHMDLLTAPCQTPLTFSSINPDDVLKIINTLKSKSSYGNDYISNKLLKQIKHELCPTSSMIINQSLVTGVFPDKLKIAKVVPIYKKGDERMLENYRPVSVLPSISKIFEKVIHIQLLQHFVSADLFYPHQYGFREAHSTELAALEFIDRLTSILDRNETPFSIFIDLSKAFDTIDHKILLDKLQYYGVKEKAFSLLKSYLSNRSQYTIFENITSPTLEITTGVPQGSILGPLLFIIYINDLNKSCNFLHPIIYADDTTLSASFKSFQSPDMVNSVDETESVNEELNNIYKWFCTNKLSLNPSKTKAMVFHSTRKRVTYPELILNGTIIEIVESFDFLGITLEKSLSWKPHVIKISKKISRTTGILSKLKHTLPQHVLLKIYHSLFIPYIDYGLLCWNSKLQELVKLQKRAIRFITSSKYNAHTEPLFKNLKLLKIDDLVTMKYLKFCYKLENSILPSYFMNNLFIKVGSIQNRRLRNQNQLRVPRVKHEYARNAISYTVPVHFNSCPPNILEKVYTHSFPGFCRYVKTQLLQNYNLDCNIRNCYICNRINLV